MFDYLILISLMSALTLALGIAVYKLLLARKLSPAVSRGILVAMMVLSLTIVPLSRLVPEDHVPPTPVTLAEAPEVLTVEMAPAKAQAPSRKLPPVSTIAGWILISGSVLVLLRWLWASAFIMAMMRRGEKVHVGDCNLVLLSDTRIAPFSFLCRIVMTREDFERNGEMIMAHERAHIRNGHWADLLLAHIVLCLQWYNPAAWILLSELRAVHEYQADAEVLHSGFNRQEYQILLMEKATGMSLQSMANSLNHSKLKYRIAMMNFKKNSRWAVLRMAALLPVVLTAFAITRIPAVAAVMDRTSAQTPDAGEVVADAKQSIDMAVSHVSDVSGSESKATEEVSTVPAESKVEATTATEVLPEFPGGIGAMMRYLATNVKYPENAYQSNIQGRVVVQFVVKADGKVSDIQVVRPVDPLLDAEAVRVVSSMPKWTPGTSNGTPVDCAYAIPVTFKLQGLPEPEQTADTPAPSAPEVVAIAYPNDSINTEK